MIRYCKFVNLQDFFEESRFWGIPAAKIWEEERFLNVPLFFCEGYPSHIPSELSGKAASKRLEVSCITGNGGQKTNFLLAFHGGSLPDREDIAIGLEDELTADFWRELKRVIDNLRTDHWRFHTQGRALRIGRPLIMGILNVTPDFFSDGGRYFDRQEAMKRAGEMLEAGADIIDVGGESTRPGAKTVTAEEEWRRIGGVVEALAKIPYCLVSVDTYKSEVARRALDAGAHLINDISGFSFDPQMAGVVAAYDVPAVLMHIQGTPRDMQKNPGYGNLMFEIISFLQEQCAYARSKGVR